MASGPRRGDLTAGTSAGDGRGPAATSLRRVFQASGDASVDNAVTEALKAISRVHGDGPLERLAVAAAARLEGTHQAEFVWNEVSARPIRISVLRKSQIKDLSVIHEMGHYLDLFAFGDGPRLQQRPEASHLMSLLRESADVRQLADAGVPESFRSDREVFARAYAQYVITRGGSGRLLRQLNGLIEVSRARGAVASLT